MSPQGAVLTSGTREWVRWKALDQADTLSEFLWYSEQNCRRFMHLCVFSDIRRCGMVGIGWSDGR